MNLTSGLFTTKHSCLYNKSCYRVWLYDKRRHILIDVISFLSALGGVHDSELSDDYCKRYFLVGLLLREVRASSGIFGRFWDAPKHTYRTLQPAMVNEIIWQIFTKRGSRKMGDSCCWICSEICKNVFVVRFCRNKRFQVIDNPGTEVNLWKLSCFGILLTKNWMFASIDLLELEWVLHYIESFSFSLEPWVIGRTYDKI